MANLMHLVHSDPSTCLCPKDCATTRTSQHTFAHLGAKNFLDSLSLSLSRVLKNGRTSSGGRLHHSMRPAAYYAVKLHDTPTNTQPTLRTSALTGEVHSELF
eukprot:3266319-Amphidinium_carterae.1